jgi:hypothetical protein
MSLFRSAHLSVHLSIMLDVFDMLVRSFITYFLLVIWGLLKIRPQGTQSIPRGASLERVPLATIHLQHLTFSFPSWFSYFGYCGPIDIVLPYRASSAAILVFTNV